MCGVLGVINFRGEDVTPFILETLTHLQNRGMDSVGLAVGSSSSQTSAEPVRFWKDVGSATEWFRNEQKKTSELLGRIRGNIGIGHVRYATASARTQRDSQPHYFDVGGNCLFVASNGDLPLYQREAKDILESGYPLASRCDAEVIAKMIGHRIFQCKMSVIQAFKDVGETLTGAFSLVAITPCRRRLAVMRDPIGFRPLFYLHTDEVFIACSESALLDEVGEVREVPPGQLMLVDDSGEVETIQLANEHQPHFCLMELYYFSRPDSRWGKNSISYSRRQFGRVLAQEWMSIGYPMPDIVTPVPHSGNCAAEGVAIGLNRPFVGGVIKDRYSERIFQLDERSRMNLLENRFSIEHSPDVIGKSVLMVDDSIVRGDQIRILADLAHEAGIKRVFYASTAPPHRHPCFYGINTPDPDRLIARGRSVEEVRAITKVHALHYLSLEGTYRALGVSQGFCTACFTGDYPTPVPDGHPEV